MTKEELEDWKYILKERSNELALFLDPDLAKRLLKNPEGVAAELERSWHEATLRAVGLANPVTDDDPAFGKSFEARLSQKQRSSKQLREFVESLAKTRAGIETEPFLFLGEARFREALGAPSSLRARPTILRTLRKRKVANHREALERHNLRVYPALDGKRFIISREILERYAMLEVNHQQRKARERKAKSRPSSAQKNRSLREKQH
jgi:hypothetical protein